MKTSLKALIVAIILVLALTVVSCFDIGAVAEADTPDSVETFVFDYVDGDFILTRKSTGEEIYRSTTYVIDLLVQEIEAIVGVDGEYALEIPAPTITIEVVKGGTAQSYSQDENKFSFTATATHPFDNAGLMDGYNRVNNSSGFDWTFTRNDGGETDIVGHGQTVDFGRANAYGNYKIYAYGTVSLQFDGKIFYSKGKSESAEIEIQKASGDDVKIDENALIAKRRVYGQTVASIIESKNGPSNLTYKLENAEPEVGGTLGEVVLDANKSADDFHGILVYYIVGEWQGTTFIPNESVEKVLVTLNVNIERCEVRILINNQKLNVGEDVRFDGIWQYIVAPGAGVKSSDLGLSLHLETEDGQDVDPENIGAGIYYMRGSYTNANYNVIFLDYDNKDNNTYSSKRAIVKVCPVELSTSDDHFIYTVKANQGACFEVEDELKLVDGRDGGNTLKIYNGENAVEYENLTLVIERKSADTTMISLYIEGQWKDFYFDEEGKVTISYSTKGDKADNFAVKQYVAPIPEEEKDDNTIAIVCGIVSGVVGLLGMILLVMYIINKKRHGSDDDNCDDTSSSEVEGSHETAEEKNDQIAKSEDKVQKTEDKTAEKEVLTLEEKYKLHPEFVPTPSVEDAFKGVETEDNQEDEKDNEEGADEGKITFTSKILGASVENKAIYNALKNNILSYKGVKSRVVNGGDYFRRPGKQIVKIIFIGKTIRLALALNPDNYDYNVYHQKNRGAMKKYSDTPMFVKVQSLLGVRRALKLISDLMTNEGVKPLKKPEYDDYIYNLTYGENDNND